MLGTSDPLVNKTPLTLKHVQLLGVLGVFLKLKYYFHALFCFFQINGEFLQVTTVPTALPNLEIALFSVLPDWTN